MYGEAKFTILHAEPKTKLTSYSGDGIPCLGSLYLDIKPKGNAEYTDNMFYVVDVSGPAILGLPTLEKTRLVQVYLSAIETPPQSGTERTACQMSLPRKRPRMTNHSTQHPSPEPPEVPRTTESPA